MLKFYVEIVLDEEDIENQFIKLSERLSAFMENDDSDEE